MIRCVLVVMLVLSGCAPAVADRKPPCTVLAVPSRQQAVPVYMPPVWDYRGKRANPILPQPALPPPNAFQGGC